MENHLSLNENLYQSLRYALVDRPYGSLNMRDVSEVADVPLGELFQHFGSKQALAEAMIAHACDDIYRNFDAEASASSPLKDRLLAFLSLQLEFLGPWRSLFEDQISQLFLPTTAMSQTARSNLLRYQVFLQTLFGGQAQDWKGRLALPALVGSFGVFNASVWVRWRFDDTPDKSATLAFIHEGLDRFLIGVRAWSGEA